MIVTCKHCMKRFDLLESDIQKITNTAPHKKDWLMDNFLCKDCFENSHSGEIVEIRGNLGLMVDQENN